MRLGIMQGRLLPPVEDRIQRFPRDQWADEFPLAAEAGLSSIEWIYEVYGADTNPLASNSGISRMKELSRQHDVEVKSVCADYFMDKPLLRATVAERAERVEVLRWLIERCGRLGTDRVILPFVDVSRIETPAEVKEVVALLQSVVDPAEQAGVELHLETSLPPNEFSALLEQLPKARANYDSGNSASLGYNPREEFAAYGSRIGSVHIKDRLRGGTTVPLGSGNADLEALFSLVREVGYEREFILQVARGETGDEISWARQNREFVETISSAASKA